MSEILRFAQNTSPASRFVHLKQQLVQLNSIRITTASAPPLRAPPVRARARRFQQGSFGRLHSDECRRPNSRRDYLPLFRVNTAPTLHDFSLPNQRTFGQTRRHNRPPRSLGIEFLRSPHAHLDFSLLPCR